MSESLTLGASRYLEHVPPGQWEEARRSDLEQAIHVARAERHLWEQLPELPRTLRWELIGATSRAASRGRRRSRARTGFEAECWGRWASFCAETGAVSRRRVLAPTWKRGPALLSACPLRPLLGKGSAYCKTMRDDVARRLCPFCGGSAPELWAEIVFSSSRAEVYECADGSLVYVTQGFLAGHDRAQAEQLRERVRSWGLDLILPPVGHWRDPVDVTAILVRLSKAGAA